jgi:pyruvate/2-oxoglutarate dehydrogenase complex dihydrolipoamide acyltransferase (E2) component
VAVIETDKVNVDIRSTHSGVIKKYFASEGETVQVDANFFEIDTDAAKTAAAPKQAAPAQQAASAQQAAPAKEAPAAPKKVAIFLILIINRKTSLLLRSLPRPLSLQRSPLLQEQPQLELLDLGLKRESQ